MDMKLFKHTFLLLVIVAVLNWLASEFYLYWTIWWFDMLVHFLAGCTVAMAILWLWPHINKIRTHTTIQIIFVAIFATLIIGILWELYELYFHLEFLSDGVPYFIDTSSDLLMDVSGGFIGAWHALRLIDKK
ncbi:MAG TPA: hypothetical protein VJG67_02830 [Candidatus Paceibacterota bacterium]